MNSIHVTTMQRWLDALHIFTLMIKKLLVWIINCYPHRVPGKHFLKGFFSRCFDSVALQGPTAPFTQAEVPPL